MDLPHTQAVSTISHEELEKYKELYKQYIDLVVRIHNLNLSLINSKWIHNRVGFRTTLLEMPPLIKEMRKQAMKVHAEAQNNAKIESIEKKSRKLSNKEITKRSKWTIPTSQMNRSTNKKLKTLKDK